MKPHNFSAGPAILPQEVIEQSIEALKDYEGTGLSILEVSHRGKEFVQTLERSMALVSEILGLSDDYKVMFLTGGASTQFFMTAANLLDEGDSAYYINTGTWSDKAIKEAKLFGNISELASSKADNYTYIPRPESIPNDGRYLHITSNNTVYGTQYHWWPETTMPIVCDASSDIFSRPMPIERFGCIYAGAQKNMGPAGTTLVIVREDMLRSNRSMPTMLKYATHIAKDSSYNTPPVFPIYVCMLTMQWVLDNGGLTGMKERNEAKAKILYDAIDNSSLFRGTARAEDRSLMNVTFVCDPAYESGFLDLCKKEQIQGIKGHRSVGGFRASIYNAMPISSVQHLVDVMQHYESGL